MALFGRRKNETRGMPGGIPREYPGGSPGQLAPGERERPAQSGTPLAAFADCQTPEEAMARFQTLDQGQPLQIITMFTEVRDARRNP